MLALNKFVDLNSRNKQKYFNNNNNKNNNNNNNKEADQRRTEILKGRRYQ